MVQINRTPWPLKNKVFYDPQSTRQTMAQIKPVCHDHIKHRTPFPKSPGRRGLKHQSTSQPPSIGLSKVLSGIKHARVSRGPGWITSTSSLKFPPAHCVRVISYTDVGAYCLHVSSWFLIILSSTYESCSLLSSVYMIHNFEH